MLEMFSAFDKRKHSVDVSTPKVKGLRELKNSDCTLLSPVKRQRRRGFSGSNNDFSFPLKCIRVGGSQGCFGGFACSGSWVWFFGSLFGTLGPFVYVILGVLPVRVLGFVFLGLCLGPKVPLYTLFWGFCLFGFLGLFFWVFVWDLGSLCIRLVYLEALCAVRV